MDLAIGTRLSEDGWFAYNTLSFIFPLLDVPDILRCSEVCKLWRRISKDLDPIWRSVTIEDKKLNFRKMTNILKDRNTVHLKVVNCSFKPNNGTIFNGLKKLHVLRSLELDNCPYKLVTTIMEANPNLEILKIDILNDDSGFISKIRNLYESRLPREYKRGLKNDLFTKLGNLKHLSLFGINNLDYRNFEDRKLVSNSTLDSLELGDSDYIPNGFVYILKSLTALKKLRLTNIGPQWDARSVLQSISEMNKLFCLELFEVILPLGFQIELKLCANLEELTFVPSFHEHNVGRAISVILDGVISLKGTLKKFTCGISETDWNDCRTHYQYQYSEIFAGRVPYRLDNLKDELSETMTETEITINILKSLCRKSNLI